jgi:hypothetical protein
MKRCELLEYWSIGVLVVYPVPHRSITPIS